MIQETSAKAYDQIKPELGSRQEAVYRELRLLGNATNTEIATSMYLPINQVTPRIHELRQKGYVVEGGKRQCKITGRVCIYWEIGKDILF